MLFPREEPKREQLSFSPNNPEAKVLTETARRTQEDNSAIKYSQKQKERLLEPFLQRLRVKAELEGNTFYKRTERKAENNFSCFLFPEKTCFSMKIHFHMSHMALSHRA